MAAAKQAVDYRNQLARDYAHWWNVYENGSPDPTHTDGVNLSLIKGHIEIDKRRIAEHYAIEDYPADYYRDDPSDVPIGYMARPDKIRTDAQAVLAVLEADENYHYLCSVRPALDPKTAKRLCIDNVINYVTGLRRYIDNDRLVDMRRYRPDRLYGQYNYLSSLRDCAERTRAAVAAMAVENEANGANDDVNGGRDTQPLLCARQKTRETNYMNSSQI